MTILDYEDTAYHRNLLHIFKNCRDTFPKTPGGRGRKATDVGGNSRRQLGKRGRRVLGRVGYGTPRVSILLNSTLVETAVMSKSSLGWVLPKKVRGGGGGLVMVGRSLILVHNPDPQLDTICHCCWIDIIALQRALQLCRIPCMASEDRFSGRAIPNSHSAVRPQ